MANYRRSDLNYILVMITVLVLELGNILLFFTGFKIQYVILGISSILIMLINIKKSNKIPVLTYSILISTVFLFQLFFNNYMYRSVIALSYYLIIPYVYSKSLESFEEFNRLLRNSSKIVAPIFFLGLVLQKQEFLPEFFIVERTVTNFNVYTRYTSVAGGSLALGLFSALFSITCVHWLFDKTKQIKTSLILLVISLYCLFNSLSRGAYMVTIIGCGLIIWSKWKDNNKVTQSKINIRIIFGVIFLTITAFLLINGKNDDTILTTTIQRFVSAFDFKDDEANLERVTRWLASLDAISNNLFLGTGLGTTGSVGYDTTSNNFERDILITESYLLKVFVECGIFFGLFYTLFFIKSIRDLFAHINLYDNTLLAKALFISLSLGSLWLQTLEAPLFSILFWISYSLNAKSTLQVKWINKIHS